MSNKVHRTPRRRAQICRRCEPDVRVRFDFQHQHWIVTVSSPEEVFEVRATSLAAAQSDAAEIFDEYEARIRLN